KKVIEEYIRNQIYEDKMYDQMSMKEFVDPFTGEKIK
ncbi:IS200/IS605 family transposase, partial [[Clostridium] innocuum]|nr:IS200/IS605 family transposase [[Clostridium] innocuum]MCR0131517.1 IS200/IS605 family transposase [[Clostridium] innocuum]MCR0131885.1 IS200/IS605 family transposase [[Clostridium] innocuum]MCR0132761.1 IS200/IS605 family transposase [[Clostridium] innocuum]MCR0133435.1 IS200/IS605 family transposase [[Clostridium] innocuum]